MVGATGGLGREVVRIALERGHAVTAYARTPSRLAIDHPALTPIQGDIVDAAAVQRAVSGAEAVVSCVGWSRGQDPAVYGRGMQQVIEAMQAHGVRRLVAISGAGLELEGDRKSLGRSVILVLLKIFGRSVLAGKRHEWEVIRGAPVDWTVVRVARMVAGEATGRVAVDPHQVSGSAMVAYPDVAAWMLDQLGDPTWVARAPFVSGAR